MGRCPSCGENSFFLVTTRQCVFCGKTFCNRCHPKWQSTFEMKTKMEQLPATAATYETEGLCSTPCSLQFWDKVSNYPLSKDIGTDVEGLSQNLIHSWNKAITKAVIKDYRSKAKYAVSIDSDKYASFWFGLPEDRFPPYIQFRDRAVLALAVNLEKSGRLEDSAKVYEKLKMKDKARRLKESSKK